MTTRIADGVEYINTLHTLALVEDLVRDMLALPGPDNEYFAGYKIALLDVKEMIA